MKKLSFYWIILLSFCALNIFANDLTLKSRVEFATMEEGRLLISTEDEYIKNLSKFDIDSRTENAKSTKESLLNLMQENVLEWKDEEKKIINELLDDINNDITNRGFKLDFPNKIQFVKTTGKEEGGADGYTRMNYVVLTESKLKNDPYALKKTIIHELYHILTRHNENFRFAMYKLIGFQKMNPITYPDQIKDYKITNPDAIQTDSYITVYKNGKPVDCLMIMYSKKDYTSGSFFYYINIGLLKLTKGETKEVALKKGKPTIYALNEVSNFIEQIGRNTPYLLHPEEILAENFVLALLNQKGVASPEIVENMQKELRKAF